MLKNSDIRGLIDERNEKVGKKIRDAEVNKYPFMLVVGEKEADSATLSVRQRGTGDLGEMDVQRFIQTVKDEVEKELGKQ